MILNGENTNQPPPARELRGALVALAIIPVGIAAWGILWKFNLIAAIVGFIVAFGAMYLYRWGAGGRITRLGAVIITVITFVTLALAFFGGMVMDALQAVSDLSGMKQLDLLFDSRFWDTFIEITKEDGYFQLYAVDAGLALLFGALGSFVVIKGAFQAPSAPDVNLEADAPSASTDANVEMTPAPEPEPEAEAPRAST